MSVLDGYIKKHDYLVCVDSDGCAMDTMNCKHMRCFGPCMVKEWGLEQWADEILPRWDAINLFEMTRGINRFKGLAMALKEIDAKYRPIPGIEALQDWAANAPALSNDGVKAAADAAQDPAAKEILTKAYNWSRAVNAAIVELPEEVKVPFAGAKEGLAAAHAVADVVIVSSANRDAVEEEWAKHGLLPHVDVMLAQDVGSKAHCIGLMLEYGYDIDHVVMVGDAPGDCDAAEKNKVHYFPILVNDEKASWDEFIAVALPKLLAGEYAPYGAEKKVQFLKNLGG